MYVRCAGDKPNQRLRSAVNKRGSCAAPAVPCLWQRGQGGGGGKSARARRRRCSEVRHLCGTVKPIEVVLWGSQDVHVVPQRGTQAQRRQGRKDQACECARGVQS
jgi:hypothetical protein